VFRPVSSLSVSSGKHLLAAVSAPTLKESSVRAAPVWIRHPNVDIETVDLREPVLRPSQPLVQVIGPVPPLVPVPETPAMPAAKTTVPKEKEPIRNPQRGVTPMIRNWKQIGLPMVLS